MGRQRDLLDAAEHGPGPASATRAALVPMLARLLLEAAGAGTTDVEDAEPKEAGDEPDRT